VAGSDGTDPDRVQISNATNADVTYYIVADSYNDSCGPGTLTIDPVVCNATDLGLWAGTTINTGGNSCANGTTSLDPSACTYGAPGSEMVYKLTLPAATTVTLTYVNPSGEDNVLYVLTSCTDVATCVDGVDATSNGTETMDLTSGNAQTDYFIVVDNYSGDGCDAAFTLTIAP
jgi:hypothetical protein